MTEEASDPAREEKFEAAWRPINSIGKTGKTVALNVVRLRDGLAYTELSKRLKQVGRDIPPLGLRKIESGGRRVDVDDLMAIAVALEVSPITLLMPGLDGDDEHALVPLTGVAETVGSLTAWNWLGGQAPPWFKGSVAQYISTAWPRWLQDKFGYLELSRGND